MEAAQTAPIRDRFIVRRLQRIEIPVEPGSRYEYRLRYHGQKSFIRVSKQLAEQALALRCGDVRVDEIAGVTEIRA